MTPSEREMELARMILPIVPYHGVGHMAVAYHLAQYRKALLSDPKLVIPAFEALLREAGIGHLLTRVDGEDRLLAAYERLVGGGQV